MFQCKVLINQNSIISGIKTKSSWESEFDNPEKMKKINFEYEGKFFREILSAHFHEVFQNLQPDSSTFLRVELGTHDIAFRVYDRS
jgi:hypothetical protein